MKKLIKYTLFIVAFAAVTSCEDFLDPIDENRLDFDFVVGNPATTEGLLLQGYTRIPSQRSFNEAAATDDAVTNLLRSDLKRMALGELNAQFNPTNSWINYQNIMWINRFLEVLETGTTIWNADEEINELFQLRLKGEALALRGLHHYYILQAHGGKTASGELLGVPYIKDFIEPDGDFNLPRLNYKATVDAIIEDFDEALTLLPTDYSDNESDVNPFYTERENYDFDKYKVVNGNLLKLRISGRITKALKARVALLAASPSFLDSQDYYRIAANNASEILNTVGGAAGLDPRGLEFYISDAAFESPEMLWRGSEPAPSSNLEASHFPPSVNGNGRINPTQNFVDAFPMKSGFPATAANGYNPETPYANRDPRLEKFVVLNGSSFGGGTINTGVGGGIDRLDSIPQSSTITGYYLKKLLRPDVRLNNDNSTVEQRNYNVYFRYTELALILAEAANEIGGPDFQVNGISARDIIAAIRERADLDQPDNYLASITTTEAMRDLIRNERRLELSFEGHRFWDLRRWGLSLNETATGAFFDGTRYNLGIPVEPRNYPSFAIYLPIPNNEVLRFPALEQNNGW